MLGLKAMSWSSHRKLKELDSATREVRAELSEIRAILQKRKEETPNTKSDKSSSPLVTLILGGIGTAILALFNNFSQWYSAHNLESDKLRSTLILKAVEAPTAEERKKSLVFFVESGLILDPNNRIRNLPNESIPKVESTGTSNGQPTGYNFTVTVDGGDLVVMNVVATCFGPPYDPQDTGQTTSGINLRSQPDFVGCSLPMMPRNATPAQAHELEGTPLPLVPFQTMVRVTNIQNQKTIDVPVIDIGPGKSASRSAGSPHAIDLTLGAIRALGFGSGMSNKEILTTALLQVNYRVIGGAKFLPGAAPLKGP
jgi:hypothetical protein